MKRDPLFGLFDVAVAIVTGILVSLALALLFGCSERVQRNFNNLTTPGPAYGPCGIGVSCGGGECCHEDEVCSVVDGEKGCSYTGNPNWEQGPNYYGAARPKFTKRYPERH